MARGIIDRSRCPVVKGHGSRWATNDEGSNRVVKRPRNELVSAATRGTLRLTYGQFGDLAGIPPVFFECNRTEAASDSGKCERSRQGQDMTKKTESVEKDKSASVTAFLPAEIPAR